MRRLQSTKPWLTCCLLCILIGCSDDDDRSPTTGGTNNKGTSTTTTSTGTNTGTSTAPLPSACAEDLLVARSEAPSWVTARVDVRAYKAQLDRRSGDVSVVLLGDGDQELGTLFSQQLGAQTEDAPKGAMRVRYAPVDGEELTMTTYGVALRDGHRVQMDLWKSTSPQTKLGIQSEYRQGSCQVAQRVGDQPACVDPLLREDEALPVPSCGLLHQNFVEQGAPPTLEAVRYHMPKSDALMQQSPLVSLRQDAQDSLLSVYGEGGLAESAKRSAWLDAAGVADLVSSKEAQQLYTAWVDQTWSLALGELVDQCGLQVSTGQALRTISQAVCTFGGQNLLGIQAACTPTGENAQDWTQPKDTSKPSIDPTIKLCLGGCVKGDPHLVSFDRHGFNFQGIGEYTMAKTVRGTPWEVQMRLLSHDNPPQGKPVCRDVSWVTSVAASMGEHRIGFYNKGSSIDVLWDGAPLDLATFSPPEGAIIEQKDNDQWFIKWPEGHELSVSRAVGTLSVNLTPSPESSGSVVGLLGRFDGEPSNDFTTRGGTVLEHPVSFEQLYKEFGDSWRVTTASSLFDYNVGESPETFVQIDRPGAPVGFETLTTALEPLVTQCREQGIRDPVWLEACAVDAYCLSDLVGAQMKHMAPPKSTGGGDVTLLGDVRDVVAPSSLEPMAVQPEPAACAPRAGEFVSFFKESSAQEVRTPWAIDLSKPGARFTPGMQAPEPLNNVNVDTYLIHLDTAQELRTKSYEGGARFGRRVLGVMAIPNTLQEAGLTRSGTTYPSDWKALSLEPDQDQISISSDGRGVDFRLNADGSPDLVRVIVEAP